jgi:hypothetical protein
MPRHVLIRDDGVPRVVPETPLPLEANLHDALTEHPELLPSEDMGLGRTVVVGRESAFASGYADLILIDDRGQLCLVEVKKEGNPDTRKVVAQLLDYAAALWGASLDEFERDVLVPYLRTGTNIGPVGLRSFLLDAFGAEDGLAEDGDVPQPRIGDIETALSETLRTGQFVLVVAAPEIPEGVERVLNYMNAQGLRLYGLEVSYFNGPAECFVPRLTVQPTPLDRIKINREQRSIWSEESILQKLRLRKGDEAAKVAQAIFDWADKLDLRRWYGTGAHQGACYFGQEDESGYLRPLVLFTYGSVAIIFSEMALGKNSHPSFKPEEKRRELLRRLNEIPGVSIGQDKIDNGSPSISLALLADPGSAQKFFSVMEWVFEEMKSFKTG